MDAALARAQNGGGGGGGSDGWAFASELVALARETARFRPLGATFMGPYLNTAWALGDGEARGRLEGELERAGVEFEAERARVLAGKLGRSMAGLKARVDGEMGAKGKGWVGGVEV